MNIQMSSATRLMLNVYSAENCRWEFLSANHELAELFSFLRCDVEQMAEQPVSGTRSTL